jgi:hypothetical protein
VSRNVLKALLAGRGQGLPLFLTWGLAALLASTAFQLLVVNTVMSGKMYSPSVVWVISILHLVVQAILITPHKWARLGWVVAGVFVGYIAQTAPSSFHEHSIYFWRNQLFLSLFVESVFLIGVRRRAWLWTTAIVVIYPAWFNLRLGADAVYQRLMAFLEVKFWLEFDVVYHNIVMGILLGIVVGFFMPPVDSKEPDVPRS